MKKLYDLMQERAHVYDQIKELNDKWADKVMDSADKDTFGNLEKTFDSLTEQIEACKRQQKRDELMEKEVEKKDEKTTNLFAKALSGRPEDVAKYKNTAVQQTLGTDAHAGYLTAPVEFRKELIKGLDDELFMRSISRNVGSIGEAQSLGFPYRATAADDANWTTEIGDTSEDESLAYGRREFKPNRLTKLIKLSRTLMNHASMAEPTIMEEMRYKIAVTQEKAYMTGDGSGKPLGIFTASSSGIPTTRDVSEDNTSTDVTVDGLISAKYSLKGQYHARAQWVMHRDLVKKIAKLKDGEGQYIWQPSVQVDQPDILLGRPVHMSEYAPNTFTTGKYVAVLGDFRYYWICDADSLYIQVLDQLYAEKNLIGYLFDYFGDGAPVLAEAFARVKLA